MESTGAGVKVKEELSEKVFKHVYEVIASHSFVLTTPFQSTLTHARYSSLSSMVYWFIVFLILILLSIDYSWFHGDITSEEAEELLSGQQPGTFLIRYSIYPSIRSSIHL